MSLARNRVPGLALCSAVWLAAWGCRALPSSESDCVRTCERLDSCGFLPSPIAPQLSPDDSPFESCTERCIESDSELVEMVHACAAVVRPGSPARWCPPRNKVSACEQAQFCMQGLAKDVPITGEATVRLVVRIGTARPHPPDPCELEAEQDDGVSLATPLCERLHVDAIDYFVSQGAQAPPKPKHYGCEAGLERGAEFTLKPGPVAAGILLRRNGQQDSDADDPEPTCQQFYADNVILEAGSEVTIPIFVPEGQLMLGGKPDPAEPERCVYPTNEADAGMSGE